MQQQGTTRKRSPGTESEEQLLVTSSDIVGSEDIHIRNYDHQWRYDLSIEIRTPDGKVAFQNRYYLHPGQFESELDVLPAGTYEIRATLDNLKEETISCRIDSDLEHTAVIEVGNGALSMTEGINAWSGGSDQR